METEDVVKVVDEWCRLTSELGRQFRWVQIFENRGAMMGCSNPHPHCQIWSSDFLPNEAAVKDRTQREFYRVNDGKPMLLDYLEVELAEKVKYLISSHKQN